MTTPQALFSGAVLIAASILFVNTIRPAQAQLGAGQFLLEHHSNSLANAGVFKINTANGDVSYCYITGNTELVCSHPVR